MKEILKKFIPDFVLSWYHWKLALAAAILYWFPSRKLKTIGVTGTNGKSTVAEMVLKILEEAGYKTAVLSSIRFKIGEKDWPNTLKMTMPGRFRIQRFLRQAVNAGCQYAGLEVTSEGIKQHRHKFIDFEAAGFTNLSPEHIEAHAGFENYRAAKGKLFQAAKKIHIINLDDENAEYFLQFPAAKKLGFSLLKNREHSSVSFSRERVSAITAENIRASSAGIQFSVENEQFTLSLMGEFNIYNALAAIYVGISQGINLETCKAAVEKIKGIPGRMEEVVSEPFKVFVDYAFTPNALEKVYRTIKNNFQPQKMICVLGACGGGRDKWKRPVLGELAAQYCDEIIVTNEDPYDENPMEIIDEVAEGTSGKAKKILDRREAIGESLKLARPGDVVVITGKGCEPWICLAKGKKIPWDDRQVVKEEFQKFQK